MALSKNSKILVSDITAIQTTANSALSTATNALDVANSKISPNSDATLSYLTLTAQNSDSEGGELALNGSGSYASKPLYIDHFQNSVRVHDGTKVGLTVDFGSSNVYAFGSAVGFPQAVVKNCGDYDNSAWTLPSGGTWAVLWWDTNIADFHGLSGYYAGGSVLAAR